MPSPSTWSGIPSIRGSSEPMRMFLLTFSMIGMQFTWGLEMTYCTPYLLSLGLTKSTSALVWIVGPTAGLITQPILGYVSDRSRSRFGRRRPFLLGAALLVSLALLTLGWADEIVGTLLTEQEPWKGQAVVAVACFSIWLIDLSTNVVQACCRSLIVDTLPIPKQQTGSAWAARMSASGHVAGYLIGTFDLVAIFPTWLGGDTQFKKQIVVAVFMMIFAVSVTCYAVHERVLLGPASVGLDEKEGSAMDVLQVLWSRVFNLPPRIRAICWVDFWAWLAWFPFLFYSTIWIGEVYYRYDAPPPTPGEPVDHDALGQVGRLGSRALVIFSIISFASSVITPHLIKPHASARQTGPSRKFTRRPPGFLPKAALVVLSKLSVLKPDIVTAWLLAHILMFLIFMWAPAVHSLSFATLIVAVAGIPWSITVWAPYAELGVEINRLSLDGNGIPVGGSAPVIPRGGYAPVRMSQEQDDPSMADGIEIQELPSHTRSLSAASSGILRVQHPDSDDDLDEPASTGELAGVYLGVLNIYVTMPQFIGTAVSWVIFSILEPSRKSASESEKDGDQGHQWLGVKKDGLSATGVCLFVGAIWALMAAESTRRLRKMS